MNGDSLANLLTGTDADELIQGLEGNDTLSGGAGTDTLVGDIGFDTFVINPGDERIEISDFTLFSDTLDLSGFERSVAANALLSAQGGDGVVLNFLDGTEVTIFGDGLSLSNFQLMEVIAAGGNQEPTGEILISGDVELGAELSVDVSQILDADGILADKTTIVWLRDGKAIPGATTTNYVVTDEDLSAAISVRYSYLDVLGQFETVLSAPLGEDDGPSSGVPDNASAPDLSEPPTEPEAGKGINDTIVTPTPFNDVFAARAGMTDIDGAGGVDLVVFAGDQSHYSLHLSAGSTIVSDKRPDGVGEISLTNIEQIDFEERSTSMDQVIDLRQFGSHTQLSEADFEAFIEMYIAYFNRAPDAIGLAFWGSAYANGTTMEEIASLFASQPETLATYPADEHNVRFVADVYQNVLGRVPDLEGLQFWKEALDDGQVSRGTFILELLRGVDVSPSLDATQAFIDKQLADQAYLDAKTDLGAYFSVHNGLSDVSDAAMIMSMFDGSAESLNSAVEAVDALYSAAQDPVSGDFLMPLVGVLDDPFAV